MKNLLPIATLILLTFACSSGSMPTDEDVAGVEQAICGRKPCTGLVRECGSLGTMGFQGCDQNTGIWTECVYNDVGAPWCTTGQVRDCSIPGDVHHRTGTQTCSVNRIWTDCNCGGGGYPGH